MSWVSAVLALIRMADGIFKWLHDQGKIQEGEDRAVLRALKEVASRSARAKEIDEEYRKKTDQQIIADVEQQGDFRD
jgi:hypothetical protein